MTLDRPTDKHCGDYEYITELNGIWFIVSIRGEYRIHPDEIPDELRDKPLPPSRFWGWKKTGLAWLAGAVTTLLISLAMHQRDQHLFAIYLYASILLPVFGLPALLLIIPLTSNTRAERERCAERPTSRLDPGHLPGLRQSSSQPSGSTPLATTSNRQAPPGGSEPGQPTTPATCGPYTGGTPANRTRASPSDHSCSGCRKKNLASGRPGRCVTCSMRLCARGSRPPFLCAARGCP